MDKRIDVVLEGIARHSWSICVVALVCGGAMFAAAWYGTPRTQVTGYAEIARVYSVTFEGGSREWLVNPAVVVAGQVNTGVFSPPSAGKRNRIVARVLIRTENLELQVRADSRDEGAAAIQELLGRIAADHRLRQQPELGRLRKRHESIGREIDSLRLARNQFDRGLTDPSKGGIEKAGLAHFILVTLRVQADKDLRLLEREHQALRDALDMTGESQTRLVGGVTAAGASLLPGVLLGFFGLVAGALAASLVAGFAAYRGMRETA